MNFECKYLVYPVGKNCTVTIDPVFPVRVNAQDDYKIAIKPFSGLRVYGLRGKANAPKKQDMDLFRRKHDLKINGNSLTLNFTFPQEDRYIVRLYVNDIETDVFELYALQDDLFAKTPYMGDNHMHTWNSDGTDSPQYIAAAMSRRGYDYVVVTDHHKYEPSVEAKQFFEAAGADFLVIPGEEVHSPDNPVHIINLGGEKSITAWFSQNEAEYRSAVEAELRKMDVDMVDELKYAAAASQVIFDKIGEVNGISVLCHPAWIIANGFNMAEDITDYLMDHKRFDALELIAGGAFEEGTQMQVSYYHDLDTMPILGSSDTHSTNGNGRLEPGNFTIVFADKLDRESIKNAIKSGRTIAGNSNKLYGDYRFMKYGYFLMKYYYPKHHALRDKLGTWMLRYASCGLGLDSVQAKNIKEPRPSELFESIRYK